MGKFTFQISLYAAFPVTQNQKNTEHKVYICLYIYPLAVLVFYPLQLTVWNVKSFGAPHTIRKLLNEKHTSLSSVCVYINICWTDTWPPRKPFTGRCQSEFWILIFSFTFGKKNHIYYCVHGHTIAIHINIACGSSKGKRKNYLTRSIFMNYAKLLF